MAGGNAAHWFQCKDPAVQVRSYFYNRQLCLFPGPPVYEVEVLVPDEIMGDVMGDLQTRRSIILGMEAEGPYQKLKAKVPLAELHNYSSSLRSISQGRAKYRRKFSEYAIVPMEVQQKLVAEKEKELQEA